MRFPSRMGSGGRTGWRIPTETLVCEHLSQTNFSVRTREPSGGLTTGALTPTISKGLLRRPSEEDAVSLQRTLNAFYTPAAGTLCFTGSKLCAGTSCLSDGQGKANGTRYCRTFRGCTQSDRTWRDNIIYIRGSAYWPLHNAMIFTPKRTILTPPTDRRPTHSGQAVEI